MKPGQRVRDKELGEGTVYSMSSDGVFALVEFDRYHKDTDIFNRAWKVTETLEEIEMDHRWINARGFKINNEGIDGNV